MKLSWHSVVKPFSKHLSNDTGILSLLPLFASDHNMRCKKNALSIYQRFKLKQCFYMNELAAEIIPQENYRIWSKTHFEISSVNRAKDFNFPRESNES